MRFGSLRPALAATAVAAFMTSAGGPALAQDMQQPPQQDMQQPQAPAEVQVDDATLQAFAEASIEVDQLVEQWSPRIQQADSEEQAQQMQQEANMEMAQAVQDAGLDVDTYNQIHVAATNDQELASQIQQYRQQAQ